MAVHLHEEDLPPGVLAPGPVAVDTETLGLITARDRLCLVQIADGRGDEHLVKFGAHSTYAAPTLRAVLAAPALSDAQQEYAASDVRYLHAMHAILVERLAREGRTEVAQACFDFLPHRARLDLAGWADRDVFSHEA